MSEERDQAVAEEPVVVTEAEAVADEANAQGDETPELDENGEPIAPEDDSEEVEHEGEKYKLPKTLAKEFREGTLRQADYTRKTQELSDHRRALDTERSTLAQQAEAREATLEQRVQLAQVDAALAQYAELDWDAYAEQHGDRAAIKAQGQWQQLRDARGVLTKEITEKETEARTASEQATANAIREAEQVLSREMQGFGPELVAKVAQTAAAYGFTRDDLIGSFMGDDGKPDVRTFKALAELAELRAYKAANEAKNTKAITAEKVGKVTPAVTVKPNGGQYKPGLDDNLPIDEWQRRRDAQLAKAGRR